MTLQVKDHSTQLVGLDRQRQGIERFVESYLLDHRVPATIARKVAREAGKAVASMPNWHASRSGRLLVHIWLFRALVDGGHKSHSAELIADLLGQLSVA